MPKYDRKSKPHILEIYKLLPKPNCRKCGQPTCKMFALLVTEGIKGDTTIVLNRLTKARLTS